MYLFIAVFAVVGNVQPKAKIPLVVFPAADPSHEPMLAPATPLAVEVQQAYVYLLRIVDRIKHGAHCPNAKIPRVELPAADPLLEALLAPATPQAVEVQVA